MKKLLIALLYTGLIATANIGAAESDLAGLRTGDLRKLVLHEVPRAVSDMPFEGPHGAVSIKEHYAGQVVVLNFWALWCAPCREEMPTLAALQAEMGGEDFAVVSVATGPNAPPAIDRFFAEVGAENLPKYRDPRSALARDMGVIGLPVTVILNRDGKEIGRLTGTADWHSDSARAIIAALIAG